MFLEQSETAVQEPTQPSAPFVFYTERRLVALTGRKARNLEELLSHLSQVSGSCIFYHTHYLYLVHHFEKPRFYNEFANWVSHALQEERLAERLAAIDLLAITSIRDLREAIMSAIQKHLESGAARRDSPAGDEFHFCEAKSFIMPTGAVAHDVPEFFEQIARVTNACLHFHFFEARLRLERPTNDFSQWLADLGETRLARAIDKLNPYVMTLDELKAEIIRLRRRRTRR
ncbi:MAG TPA: DUF5752 family protein [Terriglobales bacterium]|nr:DUF5752 family protein [Terriglobales bacterium]